MIKYYLRAQITIIIENYIQLLPKMKQSNSKDRLKMTFKDNAYDKTIFSYVIQLISEDKATMKRNFASVTHSFRNKFLRNTENFRQTFPL